MQALGVELPAFPADPVAASNWRAAAEAAPAAGFDSLWIPESTAVAGSLATVPGPITLGIISEVRPAGRHPSVLARDITAVDVLCGGRCSVLLHGGGAALAEAVQVCHLIFRGGVVSFSGRHFHLDGAVNRPLPAHRPPVLSQGSEPVEESDGWVITGSAAEVAACRRRAPAAMFLVWRGGAPQSSRDAKAILDAGADALILAVPPSPAAVTSAGQRLS